MLCFLPFGLASQKVYRDITFLPRSIREQANSSKKYNGRQELEQRKCCPDVGRGQGRERGEVFGDVRREKGGQSVASEADDQLEPQRASTWARTFGPKRTRGRGRSHDNVGQASCHREEDPKRGKGCERGIGGYDSQEPGRPIGDGENQHPGPSPERLGRVVG